MNTITIALLNKETATPLRTLDIELEAHDSENDLENHIEDWVESIHDEKLTCEDEEKALEYKNIDLETIAIIKHDLRHTRAWLTTNEYLSKTETAPALRINTFNPTAYYEYLDAIDSSRIPVAALDAAIDIDICVEDAIENYRGKYASHAEFAQEYYEETGADIGEFANYIDWEAVGSDLLVTDISECDGHYFWNF